MHPRLTHCLGFLFAEFFEEGFEGECVDDVGFGEPAFASDAGAQAEVGGLLGAVGVAVDDAFDAFGFGVGPEAPVEVETVGAGVELDPGAGLGAGVDDGALVQFVGVALEQQPAGEVADALFPKNHFACFCINGHGRKAREQTIAEQAGFAGEDLLGVQSGGD